MNLGVSMLWSVIMTVGAFNFLNRHDDVCSFWHFHKTSLWRLLTLAIFSKRHHDVCSLWWFSQNVIMTFVHFDDFLKTSSWRLLLLRFFKNVIMTFATFDFPKRHRDVWCFLFSKNVTGLRFSWFYVVSFIGNPCKFPLPHKLERVVTFRSSNPNHYDCYSW